VLKRFNAGCGGFSRRSELSLTSSRYSPSSNTFTFPLGVTVARGSVRPDNTGYAFSAIN